MAVRIVRRATAHLAAMVAHIAHQAPEAVVITARRAAVVTPPEAGIPRVEAVVIRAEAGIPPAEAVAIPAVAVTPPAVITKAGTI